MADEIKYVKDGNIEYIQFNRLLKYKNLFHAITLKTHDVGFKIRTNDLTRERSIEKVKKLTSCERIIQLKQNHTDNIITINKNNVDDSNRSDKAKDINANGRNSSDNNINGKNINYRNYTDYIDKILDKNSYADGLITNKEEIASIITIADCIPIIIYDPKHNVIANIHSGWKGTVKRIGIKAIRQMERDFQTNKDDVIFCIGPSIRKECFLVNEDVVEIYKKEFENDIDLTDIIEKTEKANDNGIQYIIDNILLYKQMLANEKIPKENIVDSKICTVCSSNEFHSRRAEGETYQTNGSITMLVL